MKARKTVYTFLITMMAFGSLASSASAAYAVSSTSTGEAPAVIFGMAETAHGIEAARLALIRQIADRYGITLADRTARWTLDEVSSIQSGLDRIADRFPELAGRNAHEAVKDLFRGVACYRDRKWHNNIAYTIGGTVSFYDVWGGYDETGRAFYLAHEMGHLLDTRHSPLHLLMGEVSQVFAQNVGAFIDEDGGYRLGRAFPQHDRRDQPRHRTDGASEDWAESFATVTVPEFEAELRDIGHARRREVQRFITLWVKKVYAEEKRLLRGVIEN